MIDDISNRGFKFQRWTALPLFWPSLVCTGVKEVLTGVKQLLTGVW